MNDLRDAIAVQQQALSDLSRCRAGSAAWADEQRMTLDRTCLDPVTADGKRLLDALRKAGHEIAAARKSLSR